VGGTARSASGALLELWHALGSLCLALVLSVLPAWLAGLVAGLLWLLGLLLVRSVRMRTAPSAVHMTRTFLTPVMLMNHEANRCASLQTERATHTILAWASFRLLRLGVEGRCRQGRKPSERQPGSAICLYVLTVGTTPGVWVWATSGGGDG
jgi:hypothetical protein